MTEALNININVNITITDKRELLSQKDNNIYSDEIMSIVNYFSPENKKETERDILRCKRRTYPFKQMDIDDKTLYIKKLLKNMVEGNILNIYKSDAGIKSYDLKDQVL